MPARPLTLVGLSAFTHDSAACVLREGELVAAAQEERFTRNKNEARLPTAALESCLEELGLDICDVSEVAFFEDSSLRRDRQQATGWRPALEQNPNFEIADRLGWQRDVTAYRHHRSHQASSFFFSRFPEAAVACFDSVGEWATTSYAVGSDTQLEPLREVLFPNSLGMFYSAVTAWLGLRVNQQEGTTMALAALGQPTFRNDLRNLFKAEKHGGFELDPRCFDLPRSMVGPALLAAFGTPVRAAGEPFEQRHADAAASAQLVLEEILLECLAWLNQETGLDALCLAGGVALNCVANGRIARESGFRRVFVQPAAGDAGGALGAAALLHVALTGERPAPIEHVALGPSLDSSRVAPALAMDSFRAATSEALNAHLVDRLEKGEVLAWCSGRLEFGPRALGQRSLLADPRRCDLARRINGDMKRRQPFRPFAPALLEETCSEVLEPGSASPFMTFAGALKPAAREELAGVCHVDGSARAQSVGPGAGRFRELLEAWHARTGCPGLLNTSLNGPAEPIVASASDAVFAAVRLGADSLVLDDWVVEMPKGDRARRIAQWNPPRSGWHQRNLYTF